MATIYEVAKLAGVSPATVSRVFNGASVSAEKTAAVREASRQLRFVPSRAARTLRGQNTEVIGLIIPDIENPYFTELARGVEDVAQSEGYSVVLCNTDADLQKEATYFQIALSENMAGVVLAPASDKSDIEDLLAAGRPVVTVDRQTSFETDLVLMDNFRAGKVATENLIRRGFSRIACITGPQSIETAYERADGWRAALRQQLGDPPDSALRYSTFRVEGGRQAMADLLAAAEPPDAVVATNNLLGVGAIQVLTEHGLTPPSFGVSVIGSLPFTTLSPSAVTVVRLPARLMGVTAATQLLERIAGEKQPARTVILPYSLESATA